MEAQKVVIESFKLKGKAEKIPKSHLNLRESTMTWEIFSKALISRFKKLKDVTCKLKQQKKRKTKSFGIERNKKKSQKDDDINGEKEYKRKGTRRDDKRPCLIIVASFVIE